MILFEHEGKALLSAAGIPTPRSVLIRSTDELNSCTWDMFPCMVKAQVLSGKRGLKGGVLAVSNRAELEASVGSFLGSALGSDLVAAVLIEEKCELNDEWYVSVTYSTIERTPILLFSRSGGMAIEDEGGTAELALNPLHGFEEFRVRNFLLNAGVSGKDLVGLIGVCGKVYALFEREDVRLIEINPLARSAEGSFMALDCKMMLDDDAAFRHAWLWPERPLMGRFPTEREKAVRAIDAGERYYRGSAGKYIELDGDIACLFSGGGASISMMDALAAASGRAANYTEYSGNPPREKVYALAKIVMSKPGLKGIWIAGGVANFTDIAATMAGIADALRDVRPHVPIVVRRAGPNEAEGKECLLAVASELKLDISWYGRDTSMTATAKMLMDKISASQTVKV